MNVHGGLGGAAAHALESLLLLAAGRRITGGNQAGTVGLQCGADEIQDCRA